MTKNNLQLPKGVYEELNKTLQTKLSQGAILVDNNYALSNLVMHIDYIMPNQVGYERLVVVQKDLSYTHDSNLQVETAMDSKVVLYEERFDVIGTTFSKYAKSRNALAIFYTIGTKLFTEVEAKDSANRIIDVRKARMSNKYNTSSKASYTYILKGLNYKGFKRGNNIVTVTLEHAWYSDKPIKKIDIKNTLTHKHVSNVDFNQLITGGYVRGIE